MPDTERLDASLMINVTQSLRVTGRIENLTDNRDPQVRDYNQIPRAAYIGLRYSI